MTSCFDCGAPVAPVDRFCGNCGLALQPAPGAEGGAASPSSPLTREPDLLMQESGASEPSESSMSEPESQGYGDDLQPTIIESSHGGQAAAAARASEPAEPSDASEPSISESASPSSASLSTAGSSELSPSFAEDAEATADTSEEQATGDVTAGQPAADDPAPEWEPAPTPSAQDTGGAASASGPRDRRTGDLPSRPMAYTGRTAGSGSSSRRSASQLEPGTVLYSRYEIVKRIGGGGMGAVYYAKDRNLGDAPRAVKEMIQTHLDESQQEKAVADFRRESMLLASLEHPSIPTIYDYFYDDAASLFYLVMKYISGGACLARLRHAPAARLDELTVAEWGAQAADVLEYLHIQRPPIIYRDLKPANLMIDGNSGRVMLIDFGIARWVAPQEKGVTAVGTMGYAPPELFSGKAESRTDIYGLGATISHLLTGSDPQDNPLLIFDFAKNPTPRQINPGISNEMEWILMRAVEYEPERRFRSAAEMRDALAQHTERLMSGRVNYGMPTPNVGVETAHMQTVYCGFCGGRIAVDDVFCAHCGARQPLAAVGASSALPHTARPTAKLVVTGTTELDASFILQKESNLLGRTDPHSNIFPEIDLSRFDPETKVSRRHARIWLEGETFLVEDLGSVNGTVINDSVRLAPRQPRVLDSGDKLRVGETTLHFLVG